MPSPDHRLFAVNAACYAGPVIGLLQTAAAIAPGLAVFVALLVGMGFTNLAFQSMAATSVQLAVDSRLRGRVTGLYMLAFIGGTPLGAPLIGALTSQFGPRTGWRSGAGGSTGR